jgi:hypothetical protein
VCELLIASKADANATDRCSSDVSNLLLVLCCIIPVLAPHPPACSAGETPLDWAICDLRPEWEGNEDKADIVALLRSDGAQE